MRLNGLLAVAGCAALLAAQAARAAEPMSLSFSEETADMMPLWIASDAGYFKEHGLAATVRYLPAQQGVPALMTNQEQIAAIGGSDAISAVAQGAKLKFVLTLTPVYTFQLWALPQYKNADALRGQRVGVPSLTGSGYSATVLTLEDLGLKTSDVQITPLGSAANVNSALIARSVAAGTSHAPATYEFQKAGLIVLADLAKQKIPSIGAGMLVTPAYLAQHRTEVQEAVAAVVEAIRRERSDRDYFDQELRNRLGVKDRAEADFTYDFYINEVVQPVPVPTVAQLKSNQDAMGSSNPKVKAVDVTTMLDPSFVAAAAKTQ